MSEKFITQSEYNWALEKRLAEARNKRQQELADKIHETPGIEELDPVTAAYASLCFQMAAFDIDDEPDRDWAETVLEATGKSPEEFTEDIATAAEILASEQRTEREARQTFERYRRQAAAREEVLRATYC